MSTIQADSLSATSTMPQGAGQSPRRYTRMSPPETATSKAVAAPICASTDTSASTRWAGSDKRPSASSRVPTRNGSRIGAMGR